jgi:hypothetical protein
MMNRSVFSPKFSLVEYCSRNRLHRIPTNGQRGKRNVQSLGEMHHREVIAKDICCNILANMTGVLP